MKAFCENTTAKILTRECFVGSEALMLVILKFIIFCNTMQCSLVDGYQYSRETCFLHLPVSYTMKMGSMFNS
jgi:hypothetical protein